MLVLTPAPVESCPCWLLPLCQEWSEWLMIRRLPPRATTRTDSATMTRSSRLSRITRTTVRTPAALPPPRCWEQHCLSLPRGGFQTSSEQLIGEKWIHYDYVVLLSRKINAQCSHKIIYHDFLPPPRRGSHVKSDKIHTQIGTNTPKHIHTYTPIGVCMRACTLTLYSLNTMVSLGMYACIHSL